jgi:hypothetical protein
LAALIFHYTNPVGAQGIAIERAIQPGRSGSVWVSPELYDQGAIASNRLAIVGKAVTTVIAIDLEALPPPTFVIPIRLGGGLARDGGGLEIKIRGSLAVPRAHFLQLNEP